MAIGVGFGRVLEGSRTYTVRGVVPGPSNTKLADFYKRCFDEKERLINPHTSNISAVDYGLRYFGDTWQQGWGWPQHDQIPQPSWPIAKAIRLLLDDEVDHFGLGDDRHHDMTQKDWLDLIATRAMKGAIIRPVGMTLSRLYTKVTGQYPPWLTERGKSPENPNLTDLLRNATPYLPMPKYRLTFVDLVTPVTLYWRWTGDEGKLRRALGDRWPKEWDEDGGGDGGGDDNGDDGGGDNVTPIEQRVKEVKKMVDNFVRYLDEDEDETVCRLIANIWNAARAGRDTEPIADAVIRFAIRLSRGVQRWMSD